MGGVIPDRHLRAAGVVEPLVEQLKEDGVVSYGLGSYGYDFRLGVNFARFRHPEDSYFRQARDRGEAPPRGIDPKNFDERLLERFVWDGGELWLPPGGFLLGETFEQVRVPRDAIGACFGKSTYARCALHVPMTPLEAGWRGRITLELSNPLNWPLRLYPGEGIIQAVFFRGEAACAVSYADRGGKYQDQPGLTLPVVRSGAGAPPGGASGGAPGSTGGRVELP
jgi:dCTP deaminase